MRAGQFMRSHVEPVWTGLDFTLSRQQIKELFRIIPIEEGVSRGKHVDVWTASMGRFMEQWRVAHPMDGAVCATMLSSGPLFYPGHEDLTPTDRLVLWLIEQDKLEPHAIAAHIDRRAWLINECYSMGDIKAHTTGWLDVRRTGNERIKMHAMRRDASRLVRCSIERLEMLGKLHAQKDED